MEQEIDLNQMVGIVRNERAKVAVYGYLDQILTKVLDADNLLKKSTADLADIERQIQDKMASLDQLEKEGSHIIGNAKQHAESIVAVAKSVAEKLVQDAMDQRGKVESSIVELMAQETKLTETNTALTAQIRSLRHEVESVESELSRAKQQMVTLREALKV